MLYVTSKIWQSDYLDTGNSTLMGMELSIPVTLRCLWCNAGTSIILRTRMCWWVLMMIVASLLRAHRKVLHVLWDTHPLPPKMCAFYNYASVGGTQRHMVVIVCLCVCACFRRKLPELVLRVRWKLSSKICNANLTQYYLEKKLVDFGLVALLWSYGMIYIRLLTLTAVFRCLESVEEQPAYNRLLFSLVVPSVPQGRQWAKLNQDNPGCRRYMGYSPQFTAWSSIRHMPKQKARTSTAKQQLKAWWQPMC